MPSNGKFFILWYLRDKETHVLNSVSGSVSERENITSRFPSYRKTFPKTSLKVSTSEVLQLK